MIFPIISGRILAELFCIAGNSVRFPAIQKKHHTDYGALEAGPQGFEP